MSKVGAPLKCTTSVIGLAVTTFRVISMVTLDEFLKKSMKSEKKNKELLLQLCDDIFSPNELSEYKEYSMLKIYEFVLVPTVHSEKRRLDGLCVLDFVFAQIYRQGFREEWAICEQVPMNSTLEEAGGKVAILERMASNPDSVETYFSDEKQGLKKRKKAARIGSYSLAATQAVPEEYALGFTYAFLCGTAKDFLEGNYDFVIDENFRRRDISGVFKEELKKKGKDIIDNKRDREKGFKIPIYVSNACSKEMDSEDAMQEKLHLYDEFFELLQK